MRHALSHAWEEGPVAAESVADRSMPLDGSLLVAGRFERDGTDLVVSDQDGANLVIAGYFTQSPPPDLVTSSGETVPGDIVAALAGPRAPGQYAQADDTGTADAPIGQVEELAGTVSAIRADGTEVELAPGMPVFQGDVIQTGPEGKVALVFADGTTFSLSPAARMVLDELVYDPGADTGSFLLSVVRGAFVFITGQIAGTGPGAMEVTTPAGVLGIRGTQVGCTIDADEGATACSLMVEPNGHVGEVIFVNDTSSILLTQPYETVLAQSRDSTLSTRQLSPEEVRSLLAGALGPGGLPEAEAGLLQKTGAATFEEPAFGIIGIGGGLLAPLGPLADLDAPEDELPDGPPEVPFMPQRPLEPEPPEPEPEPDPPTEIRPGQSTTALPLEVDVVALDLGDLVDFPPVPDRANLFESPVFADVGLDLFGDPTSLTFENGAASATITLASDAGRFQNTLGVYLILPDGRIGQPELVFANASAVGEGGDLIEGESTFLFDNQGRGFEPGSTLSLFILSDGFGQNEILRQLGEDELVLRFEEVVEGGLFPGIPDVADEGLQLFVRGENGEWVLLEGALFHTAAHLEGVPVGDELVSARGLNDDQPSDGIVPVDDAGRPINQHHLIGTNDEGGLRLGFEDLLFDGSDFDFSDLVVDVDLEPRGTPSLEPRPFAFDFTLDNAAGALSSLRLEVLNPAAGDALQLGGPFELADDGAVLRNGEETGITLERQDDTTLHFTSTEPVGIELYEELLNAAGLTTDLTNPTPGTRILEIEVVDPAGTESSLEVRFVVPDEPLIGTARADELTGTASNDALFGLAGDDQLDGRGGDDILVGGAGADRLRGGHGTDLFRIDGLADVDADGDGVVDFIDQVLDFNPLEGDLLDLSGLLEELGAGDGELDAFVNLERASDGRSVEVQIDFEGLAGAGPNGFQTVAQLLGTGDVAQAEEVLILPA